MKNGLFILIFLFATLNAVAQQDSVKYNWGVYGEDSVVESTSKTIQFENIKNGQEGEIRVSAPIDIKTITEEINEVDEPKFKGYRVQIMLSQNKNDVLKAQSEFIRYNKDVEVYIDRKAPNYRLRVGNFHNKFDGYAFQKKIDSKYPNSLVVSSQIDLPNINTETKEEESLPVDQNETE